MSNAEASIASLLLTTDAIITELPKKGEGGGGPGMIMIMAIIKRFADWL